MTTSNPTAVEALSGRLAELYAMACDLNLPMTDRASALSDIGHATPEILTALQALQLHGGGESRSDFASGSGDKVPDGWALVPLEPSDEMCGSAKIAYRMRWHESYECMHAAAYRAMLATAPKYQQALSGGGEAKPKSETASNPTLQGPTREEVARILKARMPLSQICNCTDNEFDQMDAAGHAAFMDEIAAEILALLNPTSPWRDEAAIAQPKRRCTRFAGCACWDHDDAWRAKCRHFKPLPALPGGN